MKRLKELRMAKGYTQVMFAGMLGVTQGTLASREAGTYMPTADKLPLIADALGCSIDALYGREPAGELRKEEPA